MSVEQSDREKRSAKEGFYLYLSGFSGSQTDLTVDQLAEMFSIAPRTLSNYLREIPWQVCVTETGQIQVHQDAFIKTGCGSYRDHGLVDDPSEPGDLPHSPKKGGRLLRSDGTVPLTFSNPK